MLLKEDSKRIVGRTNVTKDRGKEGVQAGDGSYLCYP